MSAYVLHTADYASSNIAAGITLKLNKANWRLVELAR